MEQRRLLLAFAVSLLLLVAYQEFVLKRYQRPRPAATTGQPTEQRAPQEAPPAPPPSELAAPLGDGTMVQVETNLFRIRITPVGARLAELQLKSYPRTVAPDSEPLDLVQPGPVLPLTLQLGDGVSDAGVVYQPTRTELVLQGAQQGEVVFTGDTSQGLHLEKRYVFTGDRYLFELTTTVSGGVRPSVVGLVLTPIRAEGPQAAAKEVAIALAERKLIEKPISSLQKPIPLQGASWAGFAAQYFLGAAMPEEGTLGGVMTALDNSAVVRLDAPLREQSTGFDVYFGPRDRDVLTAADHELDRALDFGWFWFVAIPLLHALRVIHGVTGNYGVAIIVLTALVKLATAPLTQTTFRNMREMQKIQPQMAKLRERYKDDQMALQKEMMELYRRHRVNPFSGCLPMVLQLPIFVGLYNTLSHAIELRHAPFAFWINDLSAPDRLMIAGIGIPVLTLLMGGTMFLQQWLTPQQGDPTQQRMMMFMPLVFTFMFINFPAGLVLYWLVNNVLTIAQQYLMMQSMK